MDLGSSLQPVHTEAPSLHIWRDPRIYSVLSGPNPSLQLFSSSRPAGIIKSHLNALEVPQGETGFELEVQFPFHDFILILALFMIFLNVYLQKFRLTFVKYPWCDFLSVESNLKMQTWMRDKNASKFFCCYSFLWVFYLFNIRIFQLDSGFILFFSVHDLSDSRLCSGFKDLGLIKSGRESLNSSTHPQQEGRGAEKQLLGKKKIHRERCQICYPMGKKHSQKFWANKIPFAGS